MNHIRDPLGIPRDSIQDERALGVREMETELLGWVRSDNAALVETALLPSGPAQAIATLVAQRSRRGTDPATSNQTEPMLAIESAAAGWLASLARDLCAEATNDNALEMVWRKIESRTGFDARRAIGNSAALLTSMFGLPREVIPEIYFSTWDELETRRRHMTKSEREALKIRVCAKASMLLDARDKQADRPEVGLALVRIPLNVLK